MRTLISVFAFLFIGISCACAGDYQVDRTKDTTSGGTNNTLKVYCNPPTSCSGCEVVEVYTIGAVADTVTVARVTGDLAFTNTLATVSSVSPAIVMLTGTNTLCQSWGYHDFLLFTGTGTNKVKVGTVQRLHEAGK